MIVKKINNVNCFSPNMGFYIIIRGPAGVGKTTVSKKLAEIYNGHYISIDKIKSERGLKHSEKEKLDLENIKFYKGKGSGCDVCQGIGYKGRIGIYEIFTMCNEIEDLMQQGNASEHQIRDLAIKKGMITMVQDGIIKALEGTTSIWEVFRVAEEK